MEVGEHTHVCPCVHVCVCLGPPPRLIHRGSVWSRKDAEVPTYSARLSGAHDARLAAASVVTQWLALNLRLRSRQGAFSDASHILPGRSVSPWRWHREVLLTWPSPASSLGSPVMAREVLSVGCSAASTIVTFTCPPQNWPQVMARKGLVDGLCQVPRGPWAVGTWGRRCSSGWHSLCTQ